MAEKKNKNGKKGEKKGYTLTGNSTKTIRARGLKLFVLNH